MNSFWHGVDIIITETMRRSLLHPALVDLYIKHSQGKIVDFLSIVILVFGGQGSESALVQCPTPQNT